MCGQSKAIRRRLRLQEEQLFGVPWIYTTNSGSGRWPKPPHAWGVGFSLDPKFHGWGYSRESC